jgi:hypothetical protein
MAERKICKIRGCGKDSCTRGFCNGHYLRLLRYGNPLGGRNPIENKDRICGVVGCRKPVHAKDLCEAHYSRKARNGDPTAGNRSRGTALAWLHRYVDYDKDECLIWPFNMDRGYGKLAFRGRPVFASRVMCILAHGEPPLERPEAAHSCGRGSDGCVSPKHVRWASRAENGADMIKHGTACRGIENNKSKLTEKDVIRIRKLSVRFSQNKLADMFEIAQSGVWAIIHRKTWAWLE